MKFNNFSKLLQYCLEKDFIISDLTSNVIKLSNFKTNERRMYFYVFDFKKKKYYLYNKNGL